MLARMVCRDLRRNRAVHLTLTLLIMLAAFLAATGSSVLGQLGSALDTLEAASTPPHLLQLHAGEVDPQAVERFARTNPAIADWQVQRLHNVDPSGLWFGDTVQSGEAQDVSLVAQNPRFDRLVDLDNRPAVARRGELLLPVYYHQTQGVKVGDKVRISAAGTERTFTVGGLVRDGQMNPGLVSSKRLVAHPDDLAALPPGFTGVEHIISFRLHNPAQAGEVTSAYLTAGLPQGGPSIDRDGIRLLSGAGVGLLAMVLCFVALLVVAVAFLCLRFVLLAALEDDYRDLGVLKAVGLPAGKVRRLYLAKYAVLAAVGSALGGLAALAAAPVAAADVRLYMGGGSALSGGVFAVLAALLVALLTIGYCRLVIGRVNRVSPVTAMRTGTVKGGRPGRAPRLRRSLLPVNTGVGVSDVAAHLGSYLVLLGIVTLCTFIMLVPLNLRTTIASPAAIMPSRGPSDLLLDVRQVGPGTDAAFNAAVTRIQADADVARAVPYVTGRWQTKNPEGKTVSLNVESGDHTAFAGTYLEGRAPAGAGELALSVLNAQLLQAKVGSTVTLQGMTGNRQVTVVGIYQDLTNGGRTAKGQLPWEEAPAAWYQIIVDLQPGVDVAAKRATYTESFPSARVLEPAAWLNQTFGQLITQVGRAAMGSAAFAVLLAMLMTALFVKLLLARDRVRLTVLRSLGFVDASLRHHYLTRMALMLMVGVPLGVLATNTLGELLVSLLMRQFGGYRTDFTVNPLLAYVAAPALVVVAVLVTTRVAAARLGRTHISALVTE